MAIRGVSATETEDYILTDDHGHPDHEERLSAEERGKEYEDPTIFKLGNLTHADRVAFGDMVASPQMSGGQLSMRTNRVEKANAVVQRGLRGWDNMLRHDGSKAEFVTKTEQVNGTFREIVGDESMSLLSQEAILELSSAILDKNGMRTSLEKKLDGQLQRSEDPRSVIGDVQTALNKTKEKEDAQKEQSQP